ncbi:MAG: hypothetical protein N4A49_13420 [Marinifilaceae bacterium]|jgi:hypothetical protein|nr:hypothetical protein [Marinifilaceae bacterium]
MTELLEILKISIPSLIVASTSYLLIKKLMDSRIKQLELEKFKELNKESLTIRLQAYERLILLCERINPNSLIIRENQSGLTNFELEHKLVASLKSEFEHNLSQQLYISNKAWRKVNETKDEIIMLIRKEASQLEKQDSSLGLCKSIIETYSQNNNIVEESIELLKKEVSTIWN